MTEKKYSSETTIPIDLLVCTNNVYEVLYKKSDYFGGCCGCDRMVSV
jgi:hypothetical protein